MSRSSLRPGARDVRGGGPRALDRRAFLALAGGTIGAAPFHALAGHAAAAAGHAAAAAGQRRPGGRAPRDPGYGPLRPTADETTGLPLLQLPPGFRYRSFGWTGDPLADGRPTPGAHDGMAAFAGPDGRVRLVRNHEVRTAGRFADRPVYDPQGGGGTTTLTFDPASVAVVDARTSLAGTAVNCAGGPTPWDSWLSCEETVAGPGGEPGYARPHGYVFEVPADGPASAEPLRAMGRFVHEAVAVDPATGIVYETEDRQTAGVYRFRPAEPGVLASGGRLEMLAIAGAPRADTRTGQTPGRWRPTAWAPIPDPDPPGGGGGRVFAQGAAGGGATFARLEGAWHGGGRIYIVSTTGGDAGAGQVWEYDPAGERLRLLFESPGADLLDMPDNLCVSPRGGLVLCEDAAPVEGRATDNFVRALTLDGAIAPFARNEVVLAGERNGIAGDFRASEFAGAVYSPDGQWLFVNVQRPGITFAITGPWGDGPL